MTIIACCISLKMIKKILVVLGVVDMRQLLLKGILHNLKLCPTQFISNLYHNKDHKKDYMFKTCLVNLSTWISELKCNFKRYMNPLNLAKMHTKPKQFTLEIKSDLLNSRFCLDNSTIVQWILKNVVNIVHLGTVRYVSPLYGITGCGVFKAGIQNWKGFYIKINCSQMKLLNFENWTNGEPQ